MSRQESELFMLKICSQMFKKTTITKVSQGQDKLDLKCTTSTVTWSPSACEHWIYPRTVVWPCTPAIVVSGRINQLSPVKFNQIWPNQAGTWETPTSNMSPRWSRDQKFSLLKFDSIWLVSLLIPVDRRNWKWRILPTLILTSWTEVLTSSIFMSNNVCVSSLFAFNLSQSSSSRIRKVWLQNQFQHILPK